MLFFYRRNIFPWTFLTKIFLFKNGQLSWVSWLWVISQTFRSSNSEVFCRKGVQAFNFIEKETLAQVFSCEFCEISKNTFFYRTPPVAASELCLKLFIIMTICSSKTYIISYKCRYFSSFSRSTYMEMFPRWHAD